MLLTSYFNIGPILTSQIRIGPLVPVPVRECTALGDCSPGVGRGKSVHEH
jgi:hypothetical protein